MLRASFYSSFLLFFSIVGYSIAVEVLTKCGQTLNAKEGKIMYKLNQTYDADEACAFIIRTNEYCNYTWQLESHGINEGDTHAIFIAALDSGSVNMIYYLELSESIPALNSSGYGAVVVFNTKTNLGTRFSLSFTAVKSREEELLGADFVFSNATQNETGSIDFPIRTYRKMPHSAVVVVTSGAKALWDPQFSIRVNMTQDFGNYLEPCWSFIRPYDLRDDGLWIGATVCRGEPQLHFARSGIFVGIFYTDGLVDLANGRMTWNVVDHGAP